MTPRALCLAAAAFTVGCGVVYVRVINEQGDSPAAWFLAVLAVAATASLAAALLSRGRPYAVAALVVTAGAMMISLPSVGLLLAPAVALTGGALAIWGSQPRPARSDSG